MTRGTTIIIQGGQYGSEGKGQIAAFVAHERNVWAAVRTGSINAGHTVYKGGVKFSMQILPTAWIHPQIFLILGAGCYIEPDILMREVEMIRKATGEDITRRLIIDQNCVWFGAEEAERAREANRHHAMGATGKGASEGIITKMRDRGSDNPRARLFSSHSLAHRFQFADTVGMMNRQLNGGQSILLEGTQGALLDFNIGPYPFVTTRMTNAAAWLAEAGLPPVNVETILVLRSYPIRVAGNSGPMPDEIDWPTLARSINDEMHGLGRPPLIDHDAIAAFEASLEKIMFEQFPDCVTELGIKLAMKPHMWSAELKNKYRVEVSEANAMALADLKPEVLAKLSFFEKTTVTKKLRRVSRFNYGDARKAILMNGPTSIAYTFLNYDIPTLTGETDAGLVRDVFSVQCNKMEHMLRCPIRYVTTERHQENVLILNA